MLTATVTRPAATTAPLDSHPYGRNAARAAAATPADRVARLERRRDELGMLLIDHRRIVSGLFARAAAYGIDPQDYRPLQQAIAAARRCRDLIALVEWEQHFAAAC